METFKLSKYQTKNLFLVLLAIFTVLITQLLGYTASAEELTVGGLMFAGNIDIAHVNDLLTKQGENFEKRMKQLDRLDKEVTDILKKANRPNMGGGLSRSSDQFEESKSDLATLIRSRGEVKGMFSGSGPDGGWTVAPVLADGIGSIVRNNSVLRELITFIPIESGDSYEEVISTTPVGAKWVGETEARPGTATPKLVKITTELHEEYAEPVISQRLADDSGTAMVDFLVNESSVSFAEAEELALFYGTGVNQPRGLNDYPTAATNDSTRAWGTIEHVPTGADGSLGTTEFDAIKTLFYKLRAGYRKNAVWVCNSETALELSKVKDTTDNYIWVDGGIKDGTPPTLLGRPVVICETAPGIASGSKALWFGDFNQAMRGIERPGNKVLLDPYTDKPNVVVYVYRRVGFMLRNSNAVKCLKFSAN